MQKRIRRLSVRHKRFPYFDNVLASGTCGRQDVRKPQIRLGWEMNWTEERRHLFYWNKSLEFGESVTVFAVRAAVLRLHYDVWAHKNVCQCRFCDGRSNRGEDELFIFVSSRIAAFVDWGNKIHIADWGREDVLGPLVYCIRDVCNLMENVLFVFYALRRRQQRYYDGKHCHMYSKKDKHTHMW